MKRYVLLDNDLIYDRIKLDKDKDWFIIRILEKIDSGETNSYLVRTIKLQSDNLIDLAEAGDCVEHDVNGETVIVYMRDKGMIEFEKDINGCTALWKRNDDIMRRYER